MSRRAQRNRTLRAIRRADGFVVAPQGAFARQLRFLGLKVGRDHRYHPNEVSRVSDR